MAAVIRALRLVFSIVQSDDFKSDGVSCEERGFRQGAHVRIVSTGMLTAKLSEVKDYVSFAKLPVGTSLEAGKVAGRTQAGENCLSLTQMGSAVRMLRGQMYSQF